MEIVMFPWTEEVGLPKTQKKKPPIPASQVFLTVSSCNIYIAKMESPGVTNTSTAANYRPTSFRCQCTYRRGGPSRFVDGSKEGVYEPMTCFVGLVIPIWDWKWAWPDLKLIPSCGTLRKHHIRVAEVWSLSLTRCESSVIVRWLALLVKEVKVGCEGWTVTESGPSDPASLMGMGVRWRSGWDDHQTSSMESQRLLDSEFELGRTIPECRYRTQGQYFQLCW